MKSMRLEVESYVDESQWRWVLKDGDGAFVADHEVALDREAPEYEGFVGLHRHLRWRMDPARRQASEGEELERVGRWIGTEVLGGVGPALAELAPVTARVCVPPEASDLLYRPFELGYVDGHPLAVEDVSLVFELEGEDERRRKEEIGDQLRMLAVFSLPVGTSALALRRERHELRKLINRIAGTHGKAIELRVLQYGVTRDRLSEILQEGAGWDVIHFSGHGLPAGLLLEKADGEGDLVSSPDLVELLRAGRSQLKLVTLSSCESAAATAAESLQWLGMEAPASLLGEEEEEAPLPAVARELCRGLDCAVLAMRYPVGDEFSIELTRDLYESLLGRGQPLARALQLAVPKVVGADPRPGIPPLSVGTPALFGPRAAELKLEPPAGGLVLPETRMAYFPPEPERFVGRVPQMVRATAALAPASGKTGVLVYGMAGAGKTACALELAYRFEQGRFGALAWYKAPGEGDDIRTALTGLASALEAQIPGLGLVHVVGDEQALKDHLPRLTEQLERSSMLIVLDNLESLLTDDGQWRDDRWRLLIAALTEQEGLSRVVLTSRRRPVGLDERVVAEPMHALSLAESVLLARQLPHLGALMRGTTEGVEPERGRELVRRTLELVQGHPKLIELAEGQAAVSIEALAQRLEEADGVWQTGAGRLATFLETGESDEQLKDADYRRVLDGWTRGVAGGLDETSQTMFQFLACVEEDDRIAFVVERNWGDLWTSLELAGDVPEIEQALAPLAERGLVEIETGDEETPAIYRIHPGVAETAVQVAGPEFQAAVDNELARFWATVFQHGVEGEGVELGGLVIRAGLSAAPYLLRLGEWEMASGLLEQVFHRDNSPATIQVVIPHLERIVDETRGTDGELDNRRVLASALAHARPDEAERQMRELLDLAATAESQTTSGVAGTLVNMLVLRGQLKEALELVERKKEYTRQAGLGPWTQISGEGQRLWILNAMGHHKEVLERVEELRIEMAALPEKSELPESVQPWNVWETVLDQGRSAALELGRWEQALALNAEIAEITIKRDAPILEVARTRFNDYGALLQLERYEDARNLLMACQEVFEKEQHVEGLAALFSARADLESRLGRPEDAIRFERRAVRYEYTLRRPASSAISHFNLANYLITASPEADSSAGLAHRLAAALISHQIGSGSHASRLRGLRRELDSLSSEPPYLSLFDALCAEVEQVEGVHFRSLFESLPTERAATGDEALAEVIRQARGMPDEELVDTGDLVAKWEPALVGVVAAAQGDEQAAEELAPFLEKMGQTDDWGLLVAVLRRIMAGEREESLIDGLDPTDSAIVQHTLDALAGRIELPPQGVPELSSEPTAYPKEFGPVIERMVAAAQGDEQAAEELEPLLNGLAEMDDWRNLAAVLRRILAGERGKELLEGLDPTDTAITTRVLALLQPGIDIPIGDPMPDDSPAVAALRRKVETYLRQQELGYEVVPDGRLMIRHGSTAVFLTCAELGDRTIVLLFSPVAVKIANTDGELTRFLAEKNNELLFGKFSLNAETGTVWYEHALLGDFLDAEELLVALSAVAETADSYDEQVAELAGGRRFVDA